MSEERPKTALDRFLIQVIGVVAIVGAVWLIATRIFPDIADTGFAFGAFALTVLVVVGVKLNETHVKSEHYLSDADEKLATVTDHDEMKTKYARIAKEAHEATGKYSRLVKAVGADRDLTVKGDGTNDRPYVVEYDVDHLLEKRGLTRTDAAAFKKLVEAGFKPRDVEPYLRFKDSQIGHEHMDLLIELRNDAHTVHSDLTRFKMWRKNKRNMVPVPSVDPEMIPRLPSVHEAEPPKEPPEDVGG